MEDKYHRVREKQQDLFSLYTMWYNDGKFSRHDSYKQIFKSYPRILNTIRPSHSTEQIKKILYCEIRRLTARKWIAWRRYQNNIRFNLFCISLYRKTRVDASFARYKILEYLQGAERK